MNTRTFLKSLATIAVSPTILIPRAPDAYRWSRPMALRINPAWETEEYEYLFATFGPTPPWVANVATYANGIWLHQRDPVTDKVDHSLPTLRYALDKETGLFRRVA